MIKENTSKGFSKVDDGSPEALAIAMQRVRDGADDVVTIMWAAAFRIRELEAEVVELRADSRETTNDIVTRTIIATAGVVFDALNGNPDMGDRPATLEEAEALMARLRSGRWLADTEVE